jgi:hypothetical protein
MLVISGLYTILLSTNMRRLFPSEIVNDEREFRDSERRILRDSSPIEGPFRPAVIGVGEIATHTSYGVNILVRSLSHHIKSLRGGGNDAPKERTQRNAFLE